MKSFSRVAEWIKQAKDCEQRLFKCCEAKIAGALEKLHDWLIDVRKKCGKRHEARKPVRLSFDTLESILAPNDLLLKSVGSLAAATAVVDPWLVPNEIGAADTAGHSHHADSGGLDWDALYLSADSSLPIAPLPKENDDSGGSGSAAASDWETPKQSDSSAEEFNPLYFDWNPIQSDFPSSQAAPPASSGGSIAPAPTEPAPAGGGSQGGGGGSTSGAFADTGSGASSGSSHTSQDIPGGLGAFGGSQPSAATAQALATPLSLAPSQPQTADAASVTTATSSAAKDIASPVASGGAVSPSPSPAPSSSQPAPAGPASAGGRNAPTTGPNLAALSRLFPAEVMPHAQSQLPSKSIPKLPIHFEKNQGQANSGVQFIARGVNTSILLAPTEAVMVLSKPGAKKDGPAGKAAAALDQLASVGGQGPQIEQLSKLATMAQVADQLDSMETAIVRMQLVGANPDARAEGQDEMQAKTNYLKGSAAGEGKTGIANFGRVTYHNVYDGIDLVYYGNELGQLEYDFLLSPGADPSAIQLNFEGADGVETDDQGNLVVRTAGGDMVQKAPVVYQEKPDGQRQLVSGGYFVDGYGTVKFNVAEYDAGTQLVIDPVLDFSTFIDTGCLGSTNAIAADFNGNTYVTGVTVDVNLEDLLSIEVQAFVVNIDVLGNVNYIDYLGTGLVQAGLGVAADMEGNAYITGFAISLDDPLGIGGFVTKLNSHGHPVYDTFLSECAFTVGMGIAVDWSGNAYVTGIGVTIDLENLEELDLGSLEVGALAAKVNAAGDHVDYLQLLDGGGDFALGTGIAVNNAGEAYVTGLAITIDGFAIAGFLNKLDANDGEVIDDAIPDGGAIAAAIAVDPAGSAYIVTGTFVEKFDAALDWVYTTNLDAGSTGTGVSVDWFGRAYVVGTTDDQLNTTEGAFQEEFGGGESDAFFLTLDTEGAPVYSTYLGGTDADSAMAVAVHPLGIAWVLGNTASEDFPIEAGDDVFQPSFVARFSPGEFDPGDLLVPDPVGEAFTIKHDTPLILDIPGVMANDGYAPYVPQYWAVVESGPSHGSLNIYAAGQLVYKPDPGYVGPDEFTYHLTDGEDDSAHSATVSITMTNLTSPTASSPSYSVVHDRTLFGGSVITAATDPDGDDLIFTVTAGPSHGMLFPNNDGSFVYIPTPGYTGSDGFSFTVSDGIDDDDGAVSINVTNTAPHAVSDGTFKVIKNKSLSVETSVLDNDSDPDGDALTITANTTPGHGSLSFGGAFTFTPATGYTGSDSFTYTISDGITTDVGTVSLNVVDQDVVANNDFLVLDEDASKAIDPRGNDRERNSGALTVIAVSSASHGTTGYTGGSVTYTPAANYYGPDSFTYTVENAAHDFDTGTVYVTVKPVNDAPEVTVPEEQTVDEENQLSIGGIGISDIDADDDPAYEVQVTFSVSHGTLALQDDVASGLVAGQISGNGTGSITVTAPLAKIATTLGATDAFLYTSAPNWIKPDTMTVFVSDLGNFGSGGPLSDSDSFAILHPTTAVNDAAVTAKNTPVTLDPRVNDLDPDNDPLTITGVTQGEYGGVTYTSGSVTYTPDTDFEGQDSFSYTISDGHGHTDSATVIVNVGDGMWATLLLGATTTWDSGGQEWSALQALGKPNAVPGDDVGFAWSPDDENGGIQYLTLGFEAAAPATGFLIYESEGSGFVAGVALRDADTSSWHFLAIGADTSAPGSPFVFKLAAATDYNVDAILIAVNLDHDPDYWEEIDAVYLFAEGAFNDHHAPSASNDSESTDEDTAVGVHVLGNDTNSDGYHLRLEVTAEPAHGSVYLDNNGTVNDWNDDFFVYTPEPDYNGSDSFGYRIIDIFGASDTATVNITINPVNDDPVAHDVMAAASKSTALTIGVLGSASDVDEDELSVSISGGPAHGSADMDGNAIVYTPTPGFIGQDSITYTVSDGHGGTATASILISVYESGQWANSVVAVSSEWDDDSEDDWAASQVLGAPDTMDYGAATSWAPAEADDGEQYIIVAVPTPSQATGVVIREAGGNGFVKEVFLIETNNTEHSIWSGVDPSQPGAVTDFVLLFTLTTYANPVGKIKVVIDTDHALGEWEQIDAIRMLTGGSPTGTSTSTSTSAGTGRWTEVTPDAQGRPSVEKTYQGAALVLERDFGYDLIEGFLDQLTVTDSLGRVTDETYDENGNVLTRTVGVGSAVEGTTTYVYDAGKLVSLTDANGNTTTWDYDGNTVVMTDQFELTVTKTFDSRGRLVAVIDRNDLKRTFAYDYDGHLLTETWYDTDHTTVLQTLTFTYRPRDGQITKASKTDGVTTYTYTFTYNTAGQLVQVTEPFGVSLWFGYDVSGNRTLVQDSFGGRLESTYEFGQLTSRIFSHGDGPILRVTQDYDDFGRVLEQARFDDAEDLPFVGSSEFTYDDQGRLIALVHTPADDTPISYTWEFDDEGQLIQQTDHGDTYDFTYDEQGQLTGDGTNTWEFDGNGNPNSGGDMTGLDNRLPTDGIWDYTYDFEGNLIEKELIASPYTSWTYGWDNRNELIWIEKHATHGGTLQMRVEFEYDAFGNRIQKRVDADGDTDWDTTQRYALDGWNPAKAAPVGNENWDVWADLDGSSSLTTRYVRGDVVDQLFARIEGGEDAYWYLTDHLGSIRDVIDNTGVVQDTITYDGFGNFTETHDEFGGRYKWTGREFDVETGLQFNRARYYDSAIGRWISQDPLNFTAGDSNLFRYLANSPTSATDPSGLVVSPAYQFFAGPPAPNAIPNDVIFLDEMLYRLYANNPKMTPHPLKGTIQILIALRDAAEKARSAVDLHAFYVFDDPGNKFTDYALQATQSAVEESRAAYANGRTSINLYLGHGTGNNLVNQASLAKVTQEMQTLDGLDVNNRSRPAIGYTCCFGGSYNQVIPQRLRLANSMKEVKKISMADAVVLFPPQFVAVVDEIDRRAGLPIKERITLNLYFSAFGPRRAADLQQYPADLSMRFSNWKQ